MESALKKLLEFWIENAPDERNGGFVQINHGNEPLADSEKTAVTTCRILWTFANAYRRYKDEQYLKIADRAYHYICDYFLDKEHGGLYQMLDKNGQPLVHEKRVYTQTFAISGLVQYYLATGNGDSLKIALEITDKVEKYSKNSYGSYDDMLSNDWQKIHGVGKQLLRVDNADKALRPNMHLLAAFSELYKAASSEQLKEMITALAKLICENMVNKQTGSLGQFFRDDWNIVSDAEVYGDDFEMSWILCSVVDVIEDGQLAETVEKTALRMAYRAMDKGWDPCFGGIYKNAVGGEVNADKEWWIQSEAVNGLLTAYIRSGKGLFLDQSLACWDFISKNMITADGSWYWSTTQEGRPIHSWEKRGPMMCPFHNGRMMIKTLEFFDTYLAPVTEFENT